MEQEFTFDVLVVWGYIWSRSVPFMVLQEFVGYNWRRNRTMSSYFLPGSSISLASFSAKSAVNMVLNTGE